MISCVEWVPRGSADPNPKKYELSRAELCALERSDELEDALRRREEAGDGGDGAAQSEESDGESSDDEIEDGGATGSDGKLQMVDPSTLPADLRMDEYSDDDDDDAAGTGAKVGGLILGKETDLKMDGHGIPEEEGEGMDEDNDKMGAKVDGRGVNRGDSDDSDDSDDDLADAPDTREYVPVDVEGLESMRIGGLEGMLGGGPDDDEEEADDASDVEDTRIRPTDALLCVAKTEDDFASLEVHVYETDTGNMYVHHDLPLPSFPLCLAHGDMGSDGSAGNFCAVGTFDRGIEVWNLDVLNVLEPSFALGGEDTGSADDLMRMALEGVGGGGKGKRKGKKKKKKQGLDLGGMRPGSHTGAVMALSWNKVHRQVLASGSADKTVKVWDVTRASPGGNDDPCAGTFTHHRDKVQSVAWHPNEGTVLATGSFDRTVCLVDARVQDGSSCRRAKIPADCESIVWDPHRQHLLTAASEDGTVTTWDVRKFTEGPLWSFVANEFGGVQDLSYNARIPGLLSTCTISGAVSLWDCHSPGAAPETPPHPCGSKDMGVGKLYTMSFYPSAAWLLGCAGSGNQIALWELGNEGTLRKRFEGRREEEDGAESPAVDDERISVGVDGSEGEKKVDEDFEAMMAGGDAATPIEERKEGSKKKNKGKAKKKAHKSGR